MSVTPELALAAAAAIRDTALEQQTTELLHMREQLRASLEVEITGQMGAPVYCRGSFHDGNFRVNNTLHPPGPLWEVRLSRGEGFDEGIPLRDFWDGNMEIRLGGVVYATTAAVVGTQCRVRGAAGNDSKDDVFCPILSGDGQGRRDRMAWMAINFRNLPEGPWMHLRSCARLNGMAEDTPENIFYKIAHPNQIPRRLPGQRADVTSVCFHVACVSKLIRTVRRDEEFEALKDVKLSEVESLIASGLFSIR